VDADATSIIHEKTAPVAEVEDVSALTDCTINAVRAETDFSVEKVGNDHANASIVLTSWRQGSTLLPDMQPDLKFFGVLYKHI